jgi:Galactose oxidase, central domain
MSKPKIIPYLLLNYEPKEEVKLLVTSRKELKIKVKSKPKLKNSNSVYLNPDNLKVRSSESQRPTTQAFTLKKELGVLKEPLNRQNSIGSMSAQNINRLKALNWGKKKVAINTSLNNSKINDPTVVTPIGPNKIYTLNPFLTPLIEDIKNREGEEVDNLRKNLTKDIKVTWTVRETYGDRPNSREGSQLVQVKGLIYIFGGQSRIKHTDLRQFDFGALMWKIINTTYPPQGRLGHSLVPYKGKIVLYGGESQHSQNLGIRRCSHKVFYLSVKKKKWQHYSGEGERPEPRRHHAASYIGKFMLIYGGMTQQGQILSDLFLFDMKLKKWTFPEVSIEKDPGPRSHATMTCIFEQIIKENYVDSLFKHSKSKASIEYLNGGFYLFGGQIADGVLSNSLHGLYIREGKLVWTLIKDFIGTPPCPRYNHAACAVKTKLFIFGGRNDEFYKQREDSSLDDLFCFDVSTLRWENLKVQGNIPSGRWGHCMISCGSKFLMLGGLTNKQFMNADLNVLETEKDISIVINEEMKITEDSGYERKRTPQYKSFLAPLGMK